MLFVLIVNSRAARLCYDDHFELVSRQRSPKDINLSKLKERGEILKRRSVWEPDLGILGRDLAWSHWRKAKRLLAADNVRHQNLIGRKFSREKARIPSVFNNFT
jgi:hypothetical protein